MSIIRSLRGFFRRALGFDTGSFPFSIPYGRYSGSYGVEELYAVNVCVDSILRALEAIPFELSLPDDKPVDEVSQGLAELPGLLKDYEFRQSILSAIRSGLVYGNGYLGVRKFKDWVFGVDRLNLKRLKVIEEQGVKSGALYPKYFFDGKPKRSYHFIHFRFHVKSGYLGCSFEESYPSLFSLASKVQEFAVKAVGSVPTGTLHVPMTVTPSQKDAARAELEDQLKNGGVVVIDHKASYTSVNPALKEDSYMMLYSKVVSSVASVFGLPPIAVNEFGAVSFVNSISQQTSLMVLNCLTSICAQISAELTQKLLSLEDRDRGFSIKVDANKYETSELSAKREDVLKQLEKGVLTMNEARVALGRQPYVGDIFDNPLLSMAPGSGDVSNVLKETDKLSGKEEKGYRKGKPKSNGKATKADLPLFV